METLAPPTTNRPSTEIIVPVLERINERLHQSNFREMRAVSCEFREGIAILQGHVGSFYAKQTAQELIRHIEGVVGIRNNIEVV